MFFPDSLAQDESVLRTNGDDEGQARGEAEEQGSREHVKTVRESLNCVELKFLNLH